MYERLTECTLTLCQHQMKFTAYDYTDYKVGVNKCAEAQCPHSASTCLQFFNSESSSCLFPTYTNLLLTELITSTYTDDIFH